MIWKISFLFWCFALSLQAMEQNLHEQNNLDEKEWPLLVSETVQQKIYDYELFKKVQSLLTAYEGSLKELEKDPRFSSFSYIGAGNSLWHGFTNPAYQGIFLAGERNEPLDHLVTPWGTAPLYWSMHYAFNKNESGELRIEEILNKPLLAHVTVKPSPTKKDNYTLYAVEKIDGVEIPEAKKYESHQIRVPTDVLKTALFSLRKKYLEENKAQK
ncbi:hypothetical protein HYX58_01185 [Candidatus Dependentiae bacterium]|nr:hypothetical protein [Candidatus Dependentiae bacterium]